jgi:VanZ family protein
MLSRLIQLSRRLYVPLTWSILTQVLLSIPGNLLDGTGMLHIPHLDKIAHLGLFGGLSLLWSLFLHYRNGAGKNVFLLVAMAVSIYGVAVEFFQFYFIPNRSFDVYDIVADVCGALCGYFATIVLIGMVTPKKL